MSDSDSMLKMRGDGIIKLLIPMGGGGEVLSI
jgi:hypothetical protein